MTDREAGGTQQRAAAKTARHFGPTADRYQSALERYVAAVAGETPRIRPAHLPSPWAATKVRDVMTETVVVVDEQASFKHIVDILARNRVAAVPVVDDVGRVLGLVSESDLLAKVAAGGDTRARIGTGHGERIQGRRKARGETAAELMSTPAITVSPEHSVVDAARSAARAHVRRLPVVDDENRVVGIVTRSDLLRVFLRDDDEIRYYLSVVLIPQRLVMEPQRITVSVTDGVVTLGGQVERKRLIAPLLEAVRHTAGVVAVHDRLTYEVDDTVTPAPPRF